MVCHSLARFVRLVRCCLLVVLSLDYLRLKDLDVTSFCALHLADVEFAAIRLPSWAFTLVFFLALYFSNIIVLSMTGEEKVSNYI